jgi:hypothetical protein
MDACSAPSRYLKNFPQCDDLMTADVLMPRNTTRTITLDPLGTMWRLPLTPTSFDSLDGLTLHLYMWIILREFDGSRLHSSHRAQSAQ